YEETLKIVSDVRYDSAFMFRYSVRPGTAAADFVDDVSEDDKIRRLNKLIKLQHGISYEQNQRELNQVRFALIEGYSKRSPEKMRARTDGNKTVLFEDKGFKEGAIVPVKITAADAFTLHGEIVEPN
ncbi:MAG TPA: TRAM domain-containing protein, partial [candidate division Zixibacteria bacterium]|nr:TRAM domain-containing protein [candidate division Zixibacteria bacterium]